MQRVYRAGRTYDGCPAIYAILRDAHRRVPRELDLCVRGPFLFKPDRETITNRPRAEAYIAAELEWYLTMDRSLERLKELYGSIPEAWTKVADKDLCVDSNYGRRIFHQDFGFQFAQCVEELCGDRNSRRGIMMYSGHDFYETGIDYTCTQHVHVYYAGDDCFVYQTHMRSQDAVFGYPNDMAWHHYVMERLRSHLAEAYPHCYIAPVCVVDTFQLASKFRRFVEQDELGASGLNLYIGL